ncbi:hypothetical protein AOZ07_12470 [Glutamicibacter halophytocola]|uniref:hypothetical protein n=1 Tax=Glutamicibacter halophytocola TaxID=1933880 RepID=UPI0006D4B934|nr:hypothetical protein [Glutamicibacter halophytocola]ALG29714.1 hypothetical protein AOZ07_12470 [Glutamicibacter halophytocola]
MSFDRPPYIGQVRIQDWITKDKQRINGIQLRGAMGLAAHLTADEARTLADTLHDMADRLDAPPATTTAPPARQQTPCGLSTLYTSQTLTDASGDPEQPLPATPAD